MSYKFVTREDLIPFVRIIEALDDRDQLEQLLDRLLAERDAYREVAIMKARVYSECLAESGYLVGIGPEGPAVEYVDAEAARIVEGKK